MDCWRSGLDLSVFRLVPQSKSYPPDQPYASVGGRFCDKGIATLYVTEDPEVAVAEYLRWNPELIDFQPMLRLRLFRFSVSTTEPEFDLTAEDCGTQFNLSSEWPDPEAVDPEVRYVDTRRLARWVFFDEGGAGIKFKSAAHRSSSAANHVLFTDRWASTSVPERMPLPMIDPTEIVLFSTN